MKKKILLLGAGLVSRPLVRYLLDSGIELTVATRTVSKAEELLEGDRRGRAVALDLNEPAELDSLITASDVVISLVPYTFHVQIARRCLELGRHLVTTSYVSNEMRSLSEQARAKKLLFLNEIGLDPGIDHMSAMRVINEVKSHGGKIVSFRSYCGGLPAPEDNNNPWGYKFSWSPRGVLLAGRNSARYLDGGKVKEIDGPDLFANCWEVQAESVGTLEGYPNRDSTQYISLYGLGESETVFRGTLRYPGWCRMMKGLVDLGWLELEPLPRPAATFGEATALLLGKTAELADDQDELRLAVAGRLGWAADSEALARMEWAGLFSEKRLPKAETRLDALGARLVSLLSYGPGERDMIVLLHEFVAEYSTGARRRITSTLVDFGVAGGDTAMARTVSLPCAIASRLLAEGKLQATGVRIPVDPEIYAPVLAELAKLGIVCVENYEG